MKIHCSDTFRAELADQPEYIFEKRGETNVKVCAHTHTHTHTHTHAHTHTHTHKACAHTYN